MGASYSGTKCLAPRCGAKLRKECAGTMFFCLRFFYEEIGGFIDSNGNVVVQYKYN